MRPQVTAAPSPSSTSRACPSPRRDAHIPIDTIRREGGTVSWSMVGTVQSLRGGRVLSPSIPFRARQRSLATACSHDDDYSCASCSCPRGVPSGEAAASIRVNARLHDGNEGLAQDGRVCRATTAPVHRLSCLHSDDAAIRPNVSRVLDVDACGFRDHSDDEESKRYHQSSHRFVDSYLCFSSSATRFSRSVLNNTCPVVAVWPD